MKKERVDKLLVDQALAKSRTQAQALIMAAQVCVGDYLVKKPSELFAANTVFRLKSGALPPYVSRAGEKLAGALIDFQLDPTGWKALDIGQSTGGFTDCLLQNGVLHVTGIDVGHDQLDWKIRSDQRVKAFEGINARKLPLEFKTGDFDIVVVDVSFISLTLVLPEVVDCLKSGGILVALIKPQFEVEKQDVGKGGIVKDPLLHKRVQEKIQKVITDLGFEESRIVQSRIEGTDGNQEFFIHARLGHNLGLLPNSKKVTV